jgi:hypothetical protein
MRTIYRIAISLSLAAAGSAQTRVGVFDRQSIVVAYYRSPQWAGILNAKIAERDAARKAGDTKKADELSKWGQAHQNLSHRQLAGVAPIDNIMEALQPAFAEIAKSAGVEKIVAEPPGAGVETVDVTDRIVDWLKADERTRQIIRNLRNGRKWFPG